MKYRYTKFTGDLLDEIDLEDLVSKLSDLLLSSGFSNPWGDPSSGDEDRTMQALHDAILEALFSGGVLSEEALQELLGEPADGDQEAARQQLEDLIQQIIERMMEQGFITGAPDLGPEQEARRGAGGGIGEDAGPVKFEVTDKALDFLGYRALRDLLGSIGRSSAGRHDTRHLSTGVEAISGAEALRVRRHDEHRPERDDPQRRAAPAFGRARGRRPRVVSDRRRRLFRPDGGAERVPELLRDGDHARLQPQHDPLRRRPLHAGQARRAGAVAPDSHAVSGRLADAVLFHDSAEEIPLKQLGRVRVGPYYTNTRAGLRLARRILERQKKDMRQIVMITDGKPSALTRPDGQIYKNAFGLDPFIVSETFAEVNACQKAGIMINTFMLARDHDLVAFVRRVAAMVPQQGPFTTPYTLGRCVLMDYMDPEARRRSTRAQGPPGTSRKRKLSRPHHGRELADPEQEVPLQDIEPQVGHAPGPSRRGISRSRRPVVRSKRIDTWAMRRSSRSSPSRCASANMFMSPPNRHSPSLFPNGCRHSESVHRALLPSAVHPTRDDDDAIVDLKIKWVVVAQLECVRGHASSHHPRLPAPERRPLSQRVSAAPHLRVTAR